MILLHATDIAASSEGIFIIVAACIAFASAAVAAYYSYQSNRESNDTHAHIAECRIEHDIKIEKERVEHDNSIEASRIAHNNRIEEAKLNYTFTKDCFDALSGALNLLQTTEKITTLHDKELDVVLKSFLEFIDALHVIYGSILPFIESDKIEAVKNKLADTYKVMNELRADLVMGRQIEKTETIVSFFKDNEKIKNEYENIITAELIILGKELRSFKIDQK